MIRTRIITGLAAILLITASYSFALADSMHRATVLEADTGGGYTYVHVDEGGKKFWIAGPATDVKKGSTVIFDEQIWMTNFKSKGLNRTFDRLLFVGGIQPADAASAAKPAVAARPKTPSKPAAPASPGVPSYLSAGGKQTVADLFANKNALAGKNVEVHGTVVKVSKNIMGRTWVHIEDGSSFEGAVAKIVFRTTGGAPPVGEVVNAKGRLETDVDFGAGYFYAVIIEDSSFYK